MRHRDVLLCAAGQQRNLSSQAIHGLLGLEGRSPAAFLEEARRNLAPYPSVSVRETRGLDTTPVGGEWTTGRALKVLLATGIVPALPGKPAHDAKNIDEK
jgi:hypothetical protein